ncbi:MAG: hypothetical protein SCARUB_02597 [Candidatus Scalindua rubra]|uniref:Plasmid stabilization system protein n=1 Tax=Candidatus Scalindua rubra TaxID=1872076 RepID=A0A1E3X9H2_9BACT|nr:MAG: hypothetical protein SCARUB_02597 [Candidatus Scalindua rubra]
MKVQYRKKFLKQLSRIPPEIRLKIEKFVFEELPCKSSISESGKIEKLSGYKNFYKVRFGIYRLGIESKNKTKILVIRTVMHRKEIYKYFP